MNIHAQTAHRLNELIAMARDGQHFYSEAASKVDDAQLSALFTRIAGVKQEIVRDLSAVVTSAGGEPATHGTIVGAMQEVYGKVRGALGDKRYGYVAELKESEDRLLKAFTEAASDQDVPATAREAVTRLLPEVRECHNVMRARKQAMKNVA